MSWQQFGNPNDKEIVFNKFIEYRISIDKCFVGFTDVGSKKLEDPASRIKSFFEDHKENVETHSFLDEIITKNTIIKKLKLPLQ